MDSQKLLSQLLPYEVSLRKNGSLQTGLKEFQALLTALQETITWVQAGKLEKFDSLVGENACQIRAVWMAIAFSQFSSNASLIDQIANSTKCIDELLEPKSIDSLMRSDKSLGDVLEKIDISLTDKEMFLIQSFLLSEMKTVKMSDNYSLYRIEAGEPKNFTRFGDVSVSFARNLLSKLRRALATSSVQFMRDNAQDQRMVSEEFTLEQNTLPCVPMFWAYKTVLQTAQKEGIPIVVHVKFLNESDKGYTLMDQESLLFKSDSNGYVLCQANEADRNKPACVIQGIAVGDEFSKARWTAQMQNIGVIDAILAGAADHRQYPNPELDRCIHALNDSEFEHYRALAKKEGFSSENPSTFFIQHVYASREDNILEEIASGQVDYSPVLCAKS